MDDNKAEMGYFGLGYGRILGLFPRQLLLLSPILNLDNASFLGRQRG